MGSEAPQLARVVARPRARRTLGRNSLISMYGVSSSIVSSLIESRENSRMYLRKDESPSSAVEFAHDGAMNSNCFLLMLTSAATALPMLFCSRISTPSKTERTTARREGQ